MSDETYTMFWLIGTWLFSFGVGFFVGRKNPPLSTWDEVLREIEKIKGKKCE